MSFTPKDFHNLASKWIFHEHYEWCPCIPLRKINQQSLEIDDIPYFKWVRDMGWGHFLDLQEVIYEDFNWLLYTNIVAKWKAEEISIFIKGRSHTLASTFLNEILKVLDNVNWLTPTWGVLFVKGYKPDKGVKKLVEGKTPLVLFRNTLNRTHVLCPKSGIKSNVSNF